MDFDGMREFSKMVRENVLKEKAKSLNKYHIFIGLVNKNYFPAQHKAYNELPPIFSTESITKEIAKEISDVKGCEDDKNRRDGFDCISFSGTRFNLVPRMFSIPFPKAYIDLCMFILKNWDELQHVCDGEMSVVKPSKHDDGRILAMYYDADDEDEYDEDDEYDEEDEDEDEDEAKNENEDEDEEKDDGRIIIMDNENRDENEKWHIDQSFSKKFGVHCDIANFFPSVYTHSIGWAAVGMEEAKEKKYDNIWYNEFDKFQRATTRNETKGLPIGPATSNILIEFILQKIDDKFKKMKKFGKGTFYKRYIDDYRYYAETREQAEDFVRQLRFFLSDYRLNLNDKKTKIFSLPDASETLWMNEISSQLPKSIDFTFIEGKRFFDYAEILAKNYPDKSVIKYALTSLLNLYKKGKKKKEVAEKIKEKRENVYIQTIGYVLNIAFHHPYILSTLSIEFADKDNDLWIPYESKFSIILDEAIKNQYSDIISWILYLYFIHGKEIEEDTAKEIIKTEDCFSITLLYYCKQHEKLILEYVNGFISDEKKSVYKLDSQWLLIYQLFLDEKIENPYTDKDESAFETFEILKKEGVTFVKSEYYIEEDNILF